MIKNINGWTYKKDTKGREWLYNTKGIGGALYCYFNSVQEYNKKIINNQQLIGFEGSYIPNGVYDKIVKMKLKEVR